MIVTLEQVKALLGMDPNECTLDSQILAWLPLVADEISDHTNNKFIDPRTYEAGTMVFTPAAGATLASIGLSGGQFQTEGFKANMDIYAAGSNLNDGFYSIKDVPTEILIDLNNNPSLFLETTEYTCYVYRVDFPKPLQAVAAALIGDRIQKPSDTDSDSVVKSERIGDYTIQYDSKVSTQLKDWKTVYKSTLRPYMRAKFVQSRGGNLINARNHKVVY